MVQIVLFCCCWLLYVDPIIEFGGGVALEREAGVARAVLITRGATRKRHIRRHPDTNLTRISVSEYRQIWHVVLKHATFAVSYNMSPTLLTKTPIRPHVLVRTYHPDRGTFHKPAG